MKVFQKSLIKLFFIFFIFSCSNLGESFNDEIEQNLFSNAKSVKIFSGTVITDGALPLETFFLQNPDVEISENNDTVKSAFPALQTLSSLNLIVFAENTVTHEIKDGNFTDSTKTKFMILLENGEWKIIVGVLKNGAVERIEENFILSASTVITVSDSSDSLNYEFALSPKSESFGQINLSMSVPDTDIVKLVTAECISTNKDDWNKTDEGCVKPICSLDNFTVTCASSKVKSGKYNVMFNFYDSDDTDSSGKPVGNLLYMTMQQIIVCDDMMTNAWINNGGVSLIDENGNFILTADLISDFELKSFYVSGTGSSMPEGNDSNSGTWIKPFATLERAIAKCTNNSITYDIYIDGTVDVTTELHIGDSSKTVKCNIYGIGTNAVLKNTSNSKYCTIIISGSSEAYIKNITYDGNTFGGFNNNNILTLEDCTIKNCENTDSGGGIVNTKGTLVLKNTTVQNCISAKNGGGLYVKEGNVTIDKDSVIGKPDATECAKNITGKYSNKARNGGGIFVENGQVDIYGKVSYNLAEIINASSATNYGYSSYGGGVYCCAGSDVQNPIVNLKKYGIISYNYINDNFFSSNGGGIYIGKNGSFKMEENSVIESNGAYCYLDSNGSGRSSCGGGIYFHHYGLSCVLAGIIKKNTVKTQGNYTDSSASGLQSGSVSAVLLPTVKFVDNIISCGQGNCIKIEDGPITSVIKISKFVGSDTLLTVAGENSIVSASSNKFCVVDAQTELPIPKYIDTNGNIQDASDIATAAAVSGFTPQSGVTYMVTNPSCLNTIKNLVDAGKDFSGVTLRMTNDIQVDSTLGIGSENGTSFKGTFDGAGYSVTFPAYQSVTKGLFGYAENATITNLTTEGAIYPDASNVGTVCAKMKGGKISNCVNNASITSTRAGSGIGGLVGTAVLYDDQDRSTIIENCINNGNVTANNGYWIGGIVGNGQSVIIRNCINLATITGNNCVGGICGGCHGGTYGIGQVGNLIENCGNTGSITGTGIENSSNGVGGIAGGNTSGNPEWHLDVNNCWSSGQITSKDNETENKYNGGIYGKYFNYTLSDCYYLSGSASGPVSDKTTETGVQTFTGSSNNYIVGSGEDSKDLVKLLNEWVVTNGSTYSKWKYDSTTGYPTFE